MTTFDSVTLEVSDTAAATDFYRVTGLADHVTVRPAEGPSTGFRGFAISLVVAQPGNVDAIVETAVAAGATVLKPAVKSFWGYGGILQAPDGTILKIATSQKKDTAPVTREIDQVALLLGVADVKASKRFYVEQGLPVGKSFGGKYVEFSTESPVTLALYPRRALAKDAGVPAEGSGSHRIVLGSDATLTDPDGFVWETTAA
ncbi:glyoxalase [Kribbella sp. NPDC051770]|uniref:glyoxalase n=1 Tax=Kribbella sp. NPDC051770 TaxID=3155413 RepID=UPI00343A050A